MEAKKWYLSKTIQVGILQILIGAGGLLATFFQAGTYTAESITLLIVGVLTIVLRFVTDSPVTV